MLEHSAHIHVKPGSERNFGLVFAAVLAAIALYPLIDGGGVRWLAAGASVGLVAVALVRPSVFRVPNRLWFRLGMLLGQFISPIVMALVYVVAVIPTGVLTRVAGKDPLKSARDGSLSTYWIERHWPMQPMDRQF